MREISHLAGIKKAAYSAIVDNITSGKRRFIIMVF